MLPGSWGQVGPGAFSAFNVAHVSQVRTGILLWRVVAPVAVLAVLVGSVVVVVVLLSAVSCLMCHVSCVMCHGGWSRIFSQRPYSSTSSRTPTT